MGFWSNVGEALFGSTTPNHQGITANLNPGTSVGEPAWVPGDPDGVTFEPAPDIEPRSLPFPMPSPFSGWPDAWSTPLWAGQPAASLTDTAWACLDLNASILSSLPVYRLRSGQNGAPSQVVDPLPWMVNPDPLIYTSYAEFAKQLLWDYQLGEAFLLPSGDFFINGKPATFRVVPPWMVKVEMAGPRRRYWIGSIEVTDDILHIRYQSSTMDAHGRGPLDVSGPRLVAAGVLARYVSNIAATGGIPNYFLTTDQRLTKNQADQMLDQWIEGRMTRLGLPALLSSGVKPVAIQQNAKEMALLELSQFTESRIAIMLGVPPFLVGLPSGGDSLTYSNVTSLFDFHDRSSLRPKAQAVMSALSEWALVPGETVEINRDEYTRPAMPERATGYATLNGIIGADGRPALSAEEVRSMERLHGTNAASALTGGETT